MCEADCTARTACRSTAGRRRQCKVHGAVLGSGAALRLQHCTGDVWAIYVEEVCTQRTRDCTALAQAHAPHRLRCRRRPGGECGAVETQAKERAAAEAATAAATAACGWSLEEEAGD